VQGANAALSSEHSKVTSPSFAEKVNVAVAWLVGSGGPASMVVSGGVVPAAVVNDQG
jgi:hypothetical protein